MDPICASRTEGRFNYITQRAFRRLTLSKKKEKKTQAIIPSPHPAELIRSDSEYPNQKLQLSEKTSDVAASFQKGNLSDEIQL